MADISSIKIPNGNSYNFKDATLRNTISTLAGPSSYVWEKKVLDNISVSKSGSDYQGSVTKTLSVSKSGYTAIGITGWNIKNATTDGGNSSYCGFAKLYLSNATTVTMIITNGGTNAAKVCADIYVLYRKN